MTQSELNKKPTPKPKVVVTEPEAPKTKLDLLIEELKVKKPETYEQYKKAVAAQKPAWIYPDLTVRIG